jgi:thermostable 8-oxoguanine DNA glycosylase
VIDPDNPTNYDRTPEELEEWLLFCVMAAFRSGHKAAIAVDKLLNMTDTDGSESPFEIIRRYYAVCPSNDGLRRAIYNTGIGLWRQKTLAIRTAVLCWSGDNLRSIQLDALQSIAGIGPKTARFFILHSRRDANVAALDVHILRHMRTAWGLAVPKQTPQSKRRYAAIEQLFLVKARELGKTPAELDIEIWRAGRRAPKIRPQLASTHGAQA